MKYLPKDYEDCAHVRQWRKVLFRIGMDIIVSYHE